LLEQACGASSSSSSSTTASPFRQSIQGTSAQLMPTAPSATPSDQTSTSILSSADLPEAGDLLDSTFVSCLTNSVLRLHLSNNNLYDALNRTGYIASNYQFQFDSPPQSESIFTSGWSVCLVEDDGTSVGSAERGDGGLRQQAGGSTLALGSTTIFWQCLSGDFYNLYTENWAAQCSPVQLRVTRLVKCNT
jgi:hypothetical protein